MKDLKDLRIAILTTDGFEQSELLEPYRALDLEGANLVIVAPHSGGIKGWDDGNWGKEVQADLTLDVASPRSFDALLLPGGVINPDLLRRESAAIDFVNSFFDWERPVAAICHGPQLLIEAGVVKGRRLTSFPSVKTDLINAGADWVDEEAVVDGLLVTSRSPKDLEPFISKFSEVLKDFSKTKRDKTEKSEQAEAQDKIEHD